MAYKPTKKKARKKTGRKSRRVGDRLTLIEKDGEKMRVHPSCLADHERLGWSRVQSDNAE
jgi:hypothetical protein